MQDYLKKCLTSPKKCLTFSVLLAVFIAGPLNNLQGGTPEIVSDPIAHIEAFAQTAMMINLVAQQVQMIEEAYKEAQRQIKMVTQLPAKIVNTAKNYIEDQIEGIREIGDSVKSLSITVGDSFVNAEDLFLSDDNYDKWFDPSLSADERRELVERDIERATWIRDINRQNTLAANLISENMRDKLSGGHERILATLDEVAGSDSLVAQLQSGNTIAVEAYAVMTDIARVLDLLTRAMTNYIYGQSELSEMGTQGDLDSILDDCPEGKVRDPITLRCIDGISESIEEIIKNGSVEDVEASSLYENDQAMLEEFRRSQKKRF